MVRFIDDYRAACGVESICRQLPIAPSQYHEASLCRYGAWKVWRQLQHEQWGIARCTTERLMQRIGFQGVCRGKRWKTTIPDEAADYQFIAYIVAVRLQCRQ